MIYNKNIVIPPPPHYEFSKGDTNIAKGIAAILLLVHHLFYEHPEIGPFIGNVSITYIISLLSKVCVSIFLILSGYGLSESLKKEVNIKWRHYYTKCFSKLLFNYWLVFAIFVPIGIIIFGRTFRIAFLDHIYLKVFLNVFGLQFFVYDHGYNATWWFMSLIIAYYVLFPILRTIMYDFKIYGLLFLFLFGSFINVSTYKYQLCIRISVFIFIGNILIRYKWFCKNKEIVQ